MNIRENVNAILHYEKYDRMPIVAFGFWSETVDKWAAEGHITEDERMGYHSGGDGSALTQSILKKLGFDYNWGDSFWCPTDLYPKFKSEVLEIQENGHQILRNEDGLIVLEKPGIVSIPAEIGTSLTGREAWEELYLPKLQFSLERINTEHLNSLPELSTRELPYGVNCGSMYGRIRDLLGVEHLSYLYYDDEELYREMVETFGNLAYQIVKHVLDSGAQFDYGHFWEDICFKNGPLVSPAIFHEIVGPQYKRITSLLNSHGIDIVSLDCDGKIDALIPTWLENGVNTMFPIEVGTWEASIIPWREQYGKKILGIGGMNKTVFAQDRKAVDKEIERLKAMIALGGFIPCPDHRIPPDAIFENVQYYCEQMNKL